MKNKIQLKNGLLYTSIKLMHEGKYVTIDDMGAEFSTKDELIEASGYGGVSSYAVRKRIDSIACETIALKDFKIDFGEIDPNERVNGLLGLDFLMEAKIVLDLADLIMYTR